MKTIMLNRRIYHSFQCYEKSNPSELGLDEGELLPRERSGDGGKRGDAQHHGQGERGHAYATRFKKSIA